MYALTQSLTQKQMLYINANVRMCIRTTTTKNKKYATYSYMF